MKIFYVYILSNQNGMLYTGVTSDLEGRMQEHRQKRFKGHTQKFGIDRLIYYEESSHTSLSKNRIEP
jgi:putative endonuclease